MARRGTSKGRSQEQEREVAKAFGGRVSPSSGAADTDAGDVRTETALIECKTTGHAADEKRPSLNEILTWLATVAQEAWEEGRDPMLALRISAQHHPLARPDGTLDLVIMGLAEAGTRDKLY